MIHHLDLLSVGTHLEGATGVGAYLLVFLFAMIPGIEPFIVIPVGIGLGLNPVWTGIAALLGSITAVVVIVLAYHRITTWWYGRTGDDLRESSTRYRRARRLWNRFGLPGLAVVGPILAGIHLTALVAVIGGTDTRMAIGWLSVGLVAWTLGLVAASVAGVSMLGLT